MTTAYRAIQRFNMAEADLKRRGFTVSPELEVRCDGRIWNFETPAEVVAFQKGVACWDIHIARVRHAAKGLPLPCGAEKGA